MIFTHHYRLTILSICLLLAACQKEAVTPAPPVTPPSGPVTPTQPLPEHLTMGNPSGATTDETKPTNYLLSKPQFALSHHRDRGIPNWVSWRLAPEWRGTAARQDDFRSDPELPSSWYKPGASSYTNSGFDRGHNCPSADRTNTVANNSATFLMSNIMPQAPRNNQQTWADLEDYSRDQLVTGHEVYIICGSYGRGGTGSRGGITETIDQGRVTVPARCWKVVVILPTGTDDASRVTSTTRVIAIDTPNDQAVNLDWGTYRTSVDAIEAATGLDLLSAVPTATQQVIEARTDNGPTK